MSRIRDLRHAHDAQFVAIGDLVRALAEGEGIGVGEVASIILLLLEDTKDPPRCIKRKEPSGRYVEDDAKLMRWLGVVARYGDFVVDPADEPSEHGYGYDYDPQRAERIAEEAYRCLGWYFDEIGAFLKAQGIELPKAEAMTVQGTEAETTALVSEVQRQNAELRRQLDDTNRELEKGGRGKHFWQKREYILAATLHQLATNREQVTDKQGRVIAARLAELVNDHRVAHRLPPEGWPTLDTIRETIEAALANRVE